MAAALLLALPLLSGCDRSGSAAAGPPQMPPARVTVADVVPRDVPVYLDQIGKAVAFESVSVQPQVSGKLVQIHFTDGSELKKGQKLFTIDPRPFEAQLGQANAALAQSKANLEFARQDFSRVQEAMTGNAVSKQEFDQKKSTVAVDEAQVQSAEAAVETAKLNLEYTSILSPIDGLAGIHQVDVGNVVTANTANTASLLVIQRLTPIYVDFTIPENSLDDVRHAMTGGPLKVEVSAPDAASAPRVGTLAVLDNIVQESTGTVRLRATVPNEDRFFWPGQFVRVRLILRRNPDALLVPSPAVQIAQKGPYVYVVRSAAGKDGQPQETADLRPVVPGQRQGDLIVIDRGLKPGEKVVVTGQLTLFPGAPVQVAPAEGPGGAPPPAGAPASAPSTEPAPRQEAAAAAKAAEPVGNAAKEGEAR